MHAMTMHKDQYIRKLAPHVIDDIYLIASLLVSLMHSLDTWQLVICLYSFIVLSVQFRNTI